MAEKMFSSEKIMWNLLNGKGLPGTVRGHTTSFYCIVLEICVLKLRIQWVEGFVPFLSWLLNVSLMSIKYLEIIWEKYFDKIDAQMPWADGWQMCGLGCLFFLENMAILDLNMIFT